MKQVFAVLILFSISGCAAHVQHPGTANAFDSDAYDTLLITHSVIETTKTDLANGGFGTSAPTVQTALNGLITAYNTLESVYCGQPITSTNSCAPGSYHAAAMAGTATPAQSQAVQTATQQVTTATSALASAKVVK